MPALGVQGRLQQVCQRRLARTRQPRQPHTARHLAQRSGPRGTVHIQRLQADVVGPAQCKVQHARAHGVQAQPVDEDEAPGVANGAVGVEGHGCVQRQVAHADAVQSQAGRGQVFQRVHVDLVFDGGDGRPHRARTNLQPVGPAGQQRLVGHPHQRALKLVGHFGGVGRGRENVAARDVDLGVQRQRYRLPGHGLRQVAVHRDDARHPRLPARGLNAQQVTWAHRAAGHQAAVGAQVRVGPVHPLHRQPQRPGRQPGLVNTAVLQLVQQCGSAIPGHVHTGFNHVVAGQRRQRDADDVLHAELRREGAVVGVDAFERGFVVVHQVHLVDCQHHLRHAQQMHQITVPARLREHALARIHQDHRQVGR